MKNDDFQFRLIYRKSPLIGDSSWTIYFHGTFSMAMLNNQSEGFFCPGIYGFTTENLPAMGCGLEGGLSLKLENTQGPVFGEMVMCRLTSLPHIWEVTCIICITCIRSFSLCCVPKIIYTPMKHPKQETFITEDSNVRARQKSHQKAHD